MDKKVKHNMLVTGAVVISISLLIVYFYFPKLTIKPIEYIEITPKAIAQAYIDNEVKAKKLYEGKYLSVTGKVKKIETLSGDLCVEVSDDIDTSKFVYCFFPISQEDSIARLNKGDKITITGFHDKVYGSAAQLINCKIVKQ